MERRSRLEGCGAVRQGDERTHRELDRERDGRPESGGTLGRVAGRVSCRSASDRDLSARLADELLLAGIVPTCIDTR